MGEKKDQLKPLLQILGDRINDAIMDSDGIAAAIRKIKEAGYDVNLVVEATIIFHKREGTEEPAPLVQGDKVAPGTFTTQDERDLRRWKIRLD